MPLVQMCLCSQVSYYLWQTHVRTLSSGKHTRPCYPEDMLCSLISRPSCIFSARFVIDIGTFSTDNSGMPLVARASAPSVWLCHCTCVELFLILHGNTLLAYTQSQSIDDEIKWKECKSW